MQLKLSKNFKERVAGRFSRFDMQVGVLEDGPHKQPREREAGAQNFQANLGTYAGGPVRKTETQGAAKLRRAWEGIGAVGGASRTEELTISQVSAANRERLGFNYLTEPFKRRDSNIIKFSEAFFKMASGKSQSMKRRVENLLQAIVRNPILRGEYGKQARSTTREKGFVRPMIDTAQLFKAIKGRVKGV